MNRDSLIDYCSCILFRLCGWLVSFLPLHFGLFLGRRIGDLLYAFDLKHRALVFANIKTAFGNRSSLLQLKRLTRDFYSSLGENLLEIFLIPRVDKKYFDRYVRVEGREYIDQAFKKGKGVILLGIHSGSWELSNIVLANMGFSFNVLVRDQRHPRLDKLLNSYRSRQGCKIIQRQNQTRFLIRALKNNEAVGLTADQGGRDGVLVKFFGKNASMATGAIRLALKYDAVIVPGYHTRAKGAAIKTVFEPPFSLKKSGDTQKDIRNNLQELTRIYEKNIEKYPKDYFWAYKIWKYGDEKKILVLSDGKVGHLRQSQAVASIAQQSLSQRGVSAQAKTVEVNFKGDLAKKALTLSCLFAGRYGCQGCQWCLRRFLKQESYNSLFVQNPDLVISCGSSLAAVNYLVARQNLARSVVILKPSVLSMSKFDLVIMPRHDQTPKKKNLLVTAGALNLIRPHQPSGGIADGGFCLGLLIGGDSRGFSLKKETILEVAKGVKSICEELGACLMATTSRRTSCEIEGIIKKEFQDYPRTKFLVLANEKNIPDTVPKILEASSIVITSGESISMISEAVSSGKYVIVFQAKGLNKRHRRFLRYFSENKYIYLTEAAGLSVKISQIWRDRPPVHKTEDNILVTEALGKIL